MWFLCSEDYINLFRFNSPMKVKIHKNLSPEKATICLQNECWYNILKFYAKKIEFDQLGVSRRIINEIFVTHCGNNLLNSSTIFIHSDGDVSLIDINQSTFTNCGVPLWLIMHIIEMIWKMCKNAIIDYNVNRCTKIYSYRLIKKKLHWSKNWPSIENIHFLLNSHETWSIWQAHE